MASLIVPCPHCSQPSKLDSDRLPDSPAFYPCPHCKQKVVVDKRKLLQQQAEGAAATTAAAATKSATQSAPPADTIPAAMPLPLSADRRFGRLPVQARFPSGIIVGDDAATIEEIRVKLAAVGSEVETVDSADSARSLIINESPDLCIFVGAGEITPRHESMEPLTGLPPNIRRSIYLALVADNLKTLDGTLAFMFEVNMVLGKQDLGQFEAALYSGIDYHERLYRPYFKAVDRKSSL